MARKYIIPMGKHKPVRSSWGALPMVDDKRPVQPYCYRNGQADAMLQRYNEKQAMLATQRGLDILRTLM